MPGLVELKTEAGSLADSVYFWEHTSEHPEDSIWYASPGLAEALRGVAEKLSPQTHGLVVLAYDDGSFHVRLRGTVSASPIPESQ